MTHTYTELEVSPGTYLEVREGLINAGYPQDGTTLDLRGVGLTKGVLETRLIKALAAGMRIEDGKILPDVGVEGEAAASATYTDIEVAAILSAGEHWAFRTLVVALGMIAMQPAAVQASILPIIEKNLVEILRGSAAGIKSFGAHVVSRVVDRESKRQERQAATVNVNAFFGFVEMFTQQVNIHVSDPAERAAIGKAFSDAIARAGLSDLVNDSGRSGGRS